MGGSKEISGLAKNSARTIGAQSPLRDPRRSVGVKRLT
jgi:hypothetical protein